MRRQRRSRRTTMWVGIVALLASALWTAAPVSAGETERVKGIASLGAGGADGLTRVGDRLYFSASGGWGQGPPSPYAGVWMSDGTTAGTERVGGGESADDTPAAARGFTRVSDTVFFRASDVFLPDPGAVGSELYKTRGTPDSTRLVKDIWPGSGVQSRACLECPNDSSPDHLTPYGGALYFLATKDDARGLWRSDATADGTEPVMAALVSVDEIDGFTQGEMIRFRGHLYITGASADPRRHSGLWKSDGTRAGTLLLRTIHSGDLYSRPRELTRVGDRLFFVAYERTRGWELWTSDGTRAGTRRVKDIRPGGMGSVPSWLTNVGGVLYFAANDGRNGRELWRSDGTAGGTRIVKDIMRGPTGSGPQWLANAGGSLFFRANDGTHGTEPWRSQGTRRGTNLVKDVRRGPRGSSILWPVNVGGTVYFSARDGRTGQELWKSGGTRITTRRVMDIVPGAAGSRPWGLTTFKGEVFFFAFDGAYQAALWKHVP